MITIGLLNYLSSEQTKELSKSIIISAACLENNYFQNMFKLMQEQEEEKIFKRRYLGQWIVNDEYNYIKEKEMSERLSYFPQSSIQWLSFDDLAEINNKTNNKMEEKEMKQCEFELGDVVVVKDELCDLFDGEVIVLCPGWGKENVKVNEDKNKGIVYVIFEPINGQGTGHEYQFEADESYAYKVAYNIKNGVFKLKATYEINTNVKVDENL